MSSTYQQYIATSAGTQESKQCLFLINNNEHVKLFIQKLWSPFWLRRLSSNVLHDSGEDFVVYVGHLKNNFEVVVARPNWVFKYMETSILT